MLYTQKENANLKASNDEKSKLETIKNKYGEVKDSFNNYIPLINNLYELVIYNEKKELAEEVKINLDFDIEDKFRKDSLGKGRSWKENNKPSLTPISEAIKIVEQKANDGIIELKNPSLIIDENSQMIPVNKVGDAVRKMIKYEQGVIDNVLKQQVSERDRTLSVVNKESLLGLQVLKVIFNDTDDDGNLTYDILFKRVNEFLTGTENERIMSNYFYLVKNVEKNEITKERYDYKDIDILITKANNKVIEGKKELDSERKWKAENRIREKESQIQKANLRGDTLETLID